MSWLSRLARFFVNAFNNIYAAGCIFAVTVIFAEYYVWDKLPIEYHFKLAICLFISFITGIIAGWNLKEGWKPE